MEKNNNNNNGGISIPGEVMMDILSRLPVKTLCRLRCVSKEWKGFISSSNKYFINMHQRHYSMKNPFFLQWKADRPLNNERIALDLCTVGLADRRQLHDKFRIFIEDSNDIAMAACRNLVCFKGEHIHVLNPSMREIMRLPGSPRERRCGFARLGFGYLPSLDQYKVIQWYTLDYNKIRCEILTFGDGGEGVLSSDSWREIECFASCNFKNGCVCVDGVIYWLLWAQTRDRILCFDLQEERFKFACCPMKAKYTYFSEKLVELKEFLCLGAIDTNLQQIHLWIRKKDQDDPHEYKWFKKLCVDVPSLDMFSPVACIPGDDRRGDELLIGSLLRGFFYCNIANNSVRKAEDLDMHFGFRGLVCIYYDSFFSLTSSL